MGRYDEFTADRLLAQMFEMMPEDIDKRQGAVAYDLATPAAQELQNAYIELDATERLGFTDTSEGSHLARLTVDLGVFRRPAVAAKGIVQFDGEPAQLVPQGSRVVAGADAPIYFTTDADVTLNDAGFAEVVVTAQRGGLSGNIGPGEIEALVGDLFDVVSVRNDSEFVGGSNEEDDESLRQRYFERARQPVTSGNAAHYRQWALEVPGVGDALVYPTYHGAGTVLVVILDTEATAPSDYVIDAVKEHIEAERPINADVYVEPAEEVPINVSATIHVARDSNVDEVVTEFSTALTEYLSTLAFKDTLVRYTQIASILLGVPRVVDYTDLTVNGGASNIEVDVNQVAVKGEVTFTDGAV
ncbi:phage-like element PBSX protein XkdT [Geomicrobium sp. JCM 19037]|uniref:baseplate J/gp47 family protein n=1 Tax=Geomicrobium sp. JCM 19037 TaxID=1460634 RepID=UPI00045F4092|nr:baseplate J/gp47 family protein [Geomicrobium sp. JCM 19037]GAK03244.1 phage-like element PBSX protein XkdT [Geomicrobium sp. JCM 19037]